MATIGSQDRTSKARWLVIFLILVLAAAGYLLWSLLRAPEKRPFIVPGSQAAADFAAVASREEVAKLSQRLESNLLCGAGLVSWYQQANQELGQPARWSAELLAQDQLLYGFWLAEQGNQRAFGQWHEQFLATFLSPEGLVYASRQLALTGPVSTFSDLQAQNQLEPVAEPEPSWPDSLLYARVLALAYAQWPGAELDRQEHDLAESLGQAIGPGLSPDEVVAIPTPVPTQDPAATPTPKPEQPAEPAGNGFASEPVVRLSSLDLLSLKALAEIEPGFSSRYEEALALLRGGLISDALPLYAHSYLASPPGYVRFVSQAPVVDLTDSLSCALHLAEVGALEPRTLSWLMEHLLNDKVLYMSYHIAQGQASTAEESLSGLALAARIARIADREQLYRAAAERLLWHRATSPTSSVRDAIFRQDSQGLVTMTARENILALLALS